MFKFLVGKNNNEEYILKWSRGFGIDLNEITACALECGARLLVANSLVMDDNKMIENTLLPTIHRIFRFREDSFFTMESLENEVRSIANMLLREIPTIMEVTSYYSIDRECELCQRVGEMYLENIGTYTQDVV